MINQQKIIGVLGLILFTLVFCPVSSGGVMMFKPEDANVRYLNDSNPSAKGSGISTGDFDGNGLDDVAISFDNRLGSPPSIVLFLAPFESASSFSIKKSFEITNSISGESLNSLNSMAMADLNGDGMADLIWGQYNSSSGHAEVNIVYGKRNPIGVIDLEKQKSDCRIVGVSDVAAGDFNGDGISDLAMANAGTAVGYIGLGGEGVFLDVFDLSVANPFHRIPLEGKLAYIMTGDINGDNKKDFVFSNRSDNIDGKKEVNIVFGRESLPPPPSPAVLAVDVRIIGNPAYYLFGVAMGDTTGDGRSELFLKNNLNIAGLDGTDISGVNPVLVQSTGQPNSVIFYPVFNDRMSPFQYTPFLDFDGDGIEDLFFYSTPLFSNPFLVGFLTSNFHPGGNPLSDVGSPIIQWINIYGIVGAGDLNGDGFKDLVVYEPLYSIYPPYGALLVLYGFRPLTNPSAKALRLENGSPRACLALSVDGNPTEMLLSGDIANDFKDQWVPFKPIQWVLFSSTEGTKKVTVIFRNAVGRTSELTQTTVDIQARSNTVVVGTNRLRPGGTVAFDCHIPTSGSLRARIFSSTGRGIRDLENRIVEPGIYPLFWDGRNGSGTFVGRGVYFLVIEANGERTKMEILVE